MDFTGFNLTEDNNVTRGELEASITQNYIDKAPLLHVNQLPDVAHFEGIAYCTKAYVNPDLFEQGQWNVTFFLVDGSGVKFKAVIYGLHEKTDVCQCPVYVEGVKRRKGDAFGREFVEYRLTKVDMATIDCPKSLFLKELPNYNEIKSTFHQNVDTLIPDGQLKAFLLSLNDYSMMATLEQETFEETFGTFVGARMDAFNKGASILHTLKTDSMQMDICYLALLLKLWRPEVNIDGVPLDAHVNDHVLTKELIYKSDLPKLTKIKLVDALEDSRGTAYPINKTIEGRMVAEVYKLISDTYYMQDKLYKSTGKLGILV